MQEKRVTENDRSPEEQAASQDAAPPTAAPQGVLGEAELAALRRERDDYLDSLQRLKAEFDNYRKRTAREQAELVTRANERLVKELLPVLDDLSRALQAAEEHQEATLEEGVKLVHRSFADLLRREGLVEIETNGRFDPHVHEALLSQPSEAEEGSILDVVQVGYKLGERVLRPARVIVAAPAPAPEAPEGTEA